MDEELLKMMTDAIVEEVHPEEVILFGSYARGTQNEDSDVDVLVLMPEEAQEETQRSRYHLIGRILRRLKSFPLPMDILVYSHDEAGKWRDAPGHVIAIGLREGRRLYAR